MNRPIRLLMWCPHISPGGGERLLLQLAPALARQPGIEFVRLAVPPRSLDRGDFDGSAGARLQVAAWTRSPWTEFQTTLEKPGLVRGVRGTERLKRNVHRRLQERNLDWKSQQVWQTSRDCDVVYVFWPHHTHFPKLDRPVVCTFQDTTFLDFPEIQGGRKSLAEWKLSAVWVKEAAGVVVSSEASKANLVRVFGEDSKPAVVIRHDILPDTPPSEPASLPPRLAGLPPHYIVLPSGLYSHKNHYQLLVACARFARRKKYPLVFFGRDTELLNTTARERWSEHWLFARLQGLVSRLGLVPGQDFHALGRVEDSEVLPLIQRAAALIMPTLAEGGGSYPVEEALSVGTPVLCSDIPVLREQLASRTAKIAWFDPESADTIVGALENLFDHYDDFKESTLRGMQDPRPNWDQVAAQYVEVLRRVAEEKRDAPINSPA